MLWPHLWSYHSLNDGNLWLESQKHSSILICTSEMVGINASLCTLLSPSIDICLCRTRLPATDREWAGVGRSHVSDRQLVSVSTVVLILRVRTRSKMSYHWVCVCVFVIWEKTYQLVSHAHAGRTSFRLFLQIISSHHSIYALQLDGFIKPTLMYLNEQPEHSFCFTVDINTCVFMPECKNIWRERTKSLFKWVSLWKQLAIVRKCDVYKSECVIFHHVK